MKRKTHTGCILVWLIACFPLLVWASSPIYYVHSDHLGTPQKLSDDTGTVVWEAEYEPFGEVTVDDDPDLDGHAIEFNLRFPGQYYDKYTGANYNYYRDYDPTTGRYIQSDPIGLKGGLNTYGYVYQNPLIYTDPDGLAVCGGVCVGAAVITVARVAQTGYRAYKGYKSAQAAIALAEAVNNADEDEQCPDKAPAREYDIPVPGNPDADSAGPPLSVDDAVDIVAGHGDVIASDKSTAQDIATQAGKGKSPVHDQGHKGGKPHYHPNGRNGGHAFY